MADREQAGEIFSTKEIRTDKIRDVANSGGVISMIATLFMADGKDIITGTSSGTKIASATGQKLGFWGATPVVQQVFATGTGKTVDNLITLLQTLGICKQS